MALSSRFSQLISIAALCLSPLVSGAPVNGPHSPDAAKADSYRDQGDQLDPAIAARGEAVYNACVSTVTSTA